MKNELQTAKRPTLIHISQKMFISVVITLLSLIIISAVCTYLLPAGHFEQGGEEIVFVETNDGGIPVWKAILSPFLVLGSGDGLSVIMLSVFLLVVSGSFQIMDDTGGIGAVVDSLISVFHEKKKLLLAILTLVFMMFGSFLGLFEETLSLLPVVIILCLTMGFDSYTAFLVSTIATAFGFTAAITNPFTVLLCSNLIGASVTDGIWFRLLIFIFVYLILWTFISFHLRKIEKNPEASPSYEFDRSRCLDEVRQEQSQQRRRLTKVYTLFFLFILIGIIVATALEALRSYTVVLLIVIFLFGGFVCGFMTGKPKKVFASFGRGVLNTFPAVLMIMMASAVKYVLTEGGVYETVVCQISRLTTGLSPFAALLCIFAVIIVIEFFISSSTAKAKLIMDILAGLLSVGALSLSKQTLVLTYLFSDGFTNALFPTSPVLLIALSMTGVSYGKWLKKSVLLFFAVFALAVLALFVALQIGY